MKWKPQELDAIAGEFYLAGERAPAGLYRDTESGRQVTLTREDYLPGSLDGRVACYSRLRFTWSQIQQQSEEKVAA